MNKEYRTLKEAFGDHRRGQYEDALGDVRSLSVDPSKDFERTICKVTSDCPEFWVTGCNGELSSWEDLSEIVVKKVVDLAMEECAQKKEVRSIFRLGTIRRLNEAGEEASTVKIGDRASYALLSQACLRFSALSPLILFYLKSLESAEHEALVRNNRLFTVVEHAPKDSLIKAASLWDKFHLSAHRRMTTSTDDYFIPLLAFVVERASFTSSKFCRELLRGQFKTYLTGDQYIRLVRVLIRNATVGRDLILDEFFDERNKELLVEVSSTQWESTLKEAAVVWKQDAAIKFFDWCSRKSAREYYDFGCHDVLTEALRGGFERRLNATTEGRLWTSIIQTIDHIDGSFWNAHSEKKLLFEALRLGAQDELIARLMVGANVRFSFKDEKVVNDLSREALEIFLGDYDLDQLAGMANMTCGWREVVIDAFLEIFKEAHLESLSSGIRDQIFVFYAVKGSINPTWWASFCVTKDGRLVAALIADDIPRFLGIFSKTTAGPLDDWMRVALDSVGATRCKFRDLFPWIASPFESLEFLNSLSECQARALLSGVEFVALRASTVQDLNHVVVKVLVESFITTGQITVDSPGADVAQALICLKAARRPLWWAEYCTTPLAKSIDCRELTGAIAGNQSGSKDKEATLLEWMEKALWPKSEVECGYRALFPWLNSPVENVPFLNSLKSEQLHEFVKEFDACCLKVDLEEVQQLNPRVVEVLFNEYQLCRDLEGGVADPDTGCFLLWAMAGESPEWWARECGEFANQVGRVDEMRNFLEARGGNVMADWVVKVLLLGIELNSLEECLFPWIYGDLAESNYLFDVVVPAVLASQESSLTPSSFRHRLEVDTPF